MPENKTVVYLDHSATTPPLSEVVDFYVDRLLRDFANPSSAHRLGQTAKKSLDQSRARIARVLECRPDEIVFTSGGSESINTALKGFFNPPKTHGLIASCPGEHAATRNTCAALERIGIRTIPIRLGNDGTIHLPSVESALREKPDMLTFMLVNNENGVIAPVDELVALRDRTSPKTKIHLDAVQAMGKIPLSFKKSRVDLMSLSGHKFGAPRGIGLLLVRHGLRINPLIEGGGQQGNRRSGTENPPLAAALALAIELAAERLEEHTTHVRHLRERLDELVFDPALSLAPLTTASTVPHILSVRTPGLRGETIVNGLSAEGIMISAGSACSSHKSTPSPVLKEMGLSDEAARCVIRISLGPTTTEEEINRAAKALTRLYRQLARP